jgi:hypothetical protein
LQFCCTSCISLDVWLLLHRLHYLGFVYLPLSLPVMWGGKCSVIRQPHIDMAQCGHPSTPPSCVHNEL